MSYLELLNLTREPFSNSPDPDAYYRTPTHEACLHRLEIAIRLRRGLNVVLGEVGTGKSTLCRCLLRALGGEERMDVFLLLDPGFEDADAFVRHLCELLTGQRPPEETARRDCVSLIQNRVFDRALNEGRNLVLFIDEGQKLAPAALEVLRELLNFETNTEKLLQIVIFGQPELAPIIEGMPNFKDRINEYLSLKPLSMRESVRLVRHRLRLAGGQAAERLFSLASLIALHRVSKGRPRQLMRLGHQMLLSLLVSNRRRVTAGRPRSRPRLPERARGHATRLPRPRGGRASGPARLVLRPAHAGRKGGAAALRCRLACLSAPEAVLPGHGRSLRPPCRGFGCLNDPGATRRRALHAGRGIPGSRHSLYASGREAFLHRPARRGCGKGGTTPVRRSKDSPARDASPRRIALSGPPCRPAPF